MLNKNDELKIMRYLEKNYMLEFYEIYKGAGYIELIPVDEDGKRIYFWVNSVGTIDYGDYPF